MNMYAIIFYNSHLRKCLKKNLAFLWYFDLYINIESQSSKKSGIISIQNTGELKEIQ